MTEEKQVVLNSYKRTIGDMNLESIIRFQVMLHCYLNDIQLTSSKLECLTLLGLNNGHELPDFCKMIVGKEIFTSLESARNAIYDMENKNLIEKKGDYRKIVYLHPRMKIQTAGNIWVDIDALYRENK